MASNTVVMTGNVVMTQGVNVVKGDRLWVDMNTGLSRVECKSSQCKVQALFQPNAVRDPKADAKTDSKTEAGAGKDAAKPAPRLAPISSPLNLSRPN
jgi:lipopolysaccharide export system protein LptA